MAKELKYSKILEDTSSFQLVRTNPKLTGNIKFTIDSNDQMWLNSINANSELSKSLYKKFPIDPTSSLPGNIFRFLNNGKTPSEIVFDLNETVDTLKTSSDYKDQFDFLDYFSGAKYLPSRKYSEKLTYFAPMYIKDSIPDYFVIFKIENPVNKKVDSLKSEYPYDRVEYIKEMFKQSTLIKTFNIGAGTKVGDYIRQYKNGNDFPATPLDVHFDEDRLTNWNGILYDSGVSGSRGENLNSLYSQSNPLKYFEEFITLGYERNGVIFPNILNFEFIFDDDTSNTYDFNRYVGFYVNSIELSKMDIDLDRVYKERSDWENTPRFRRNIQEYEDIVQKQNNSNGVVLPVKNSSVYFSEFEDTFKDSENLFFNYVNDKSGNLHTLNLNDPYNIEYDENLNELLSSKIRLADSSIDLGKFFGPGSLFLQDVGNSTNVRGYSTQYIKVDSLSHLDDIKIYHPKGTRSDSSGKYDMITAVEGFGSTPNPGDFYVYNDIDGTAGFDTFYINSQGRSSELASALANCINRIRNISVKAYQHNGYVFIKSNIAGDYDSNYQIEFESPTLNYSGIEIDLKTGSDLIGSKFNFAGGSKSFKNRLVIEADHFNKISENIDSILVKAKSGWSKIKNISRYQDLITESNMLNSAESSTNSYFNKIVVTLELDLDVDISYREFSMFKKFQPSFGLLSFFPIKDFDFDFYSSEYLNFPVIDLYKDYYIPPGSDLLSSDYIYEVLGTGSILLNDSPDLYSGGSLVVPLSYSSGDQITLPASSNNYSYTVQSGDPIVTFTQDRSVGNRLDLAISDDNKELQSFPGFFLLKDPSKIVPEQAGRFFELRDKHLNGLTESEYDYYKENSSLDFATKSKIVPYITKWAIPDSLDSRSNPYRLNTELSFGFNNFSPDHEDRTQNPNNFTHEWFYVESNFNYLDDESTVVLNNSYFDIPLDLDKALSDSGYFTDYFTYTPTFDGKEIARTQTRYSPIVKNNQGIYESFFKGFKIEFREFIDSENVDASGKPILNPDSDRFEDYKFTSILKVSNSNINDDSVPPIRYRMIEHKTFKYVMLVIEVSLQGSDQVDGYWKEVQTPGSPSSIDSVDLTNYLDQYSPLYTSDRVYDSINGDYRIGFKSIAGVNISDISYALLYSLRNMKFNNIEDNFSNVKLSSKLNLSSTGAFTNGGNSIEALSNPNFTNYPLNLSEEILNPSNNSFIIAHNNIFVKDEFIDLATGLTPLDSSPLISANAGSVELSTSSNVFLKDSNNLVTLSVPTSFNAGYFKDNYTFKIMSGGKGYLESTFRKLSFGEFKNRVNTLDPFIEYESYEYDSSTLTYTKSSQAGWYSNIPDISNVTKVDAILPTVDSNKPSNVSFEKIIGYRYSRASMDNSYEINRYEGGYSPIFKNLFVFNSKFNFTSNDIDNLDSANVKFNLNPNEFLKVKNFSHIKISNTKILDLESNESFDPKYELTGEIAIGRNDYDLLLSNWDYGFHYGYLSKTQNNPVAGSLRIEEDQSFIGKLISLKDEIDIDQFKISQVDDLNLVKVSDIEIAYEETDDSVEGYINIENALTSYLISDGISAKFNEFLVNDIEYIGNNQSIEDYVKKYIKSNISKLYEIVTIEFYTADDRTLTNQNTGNVNSIQFSLLTDDERRNLGFKQDNNLQINKTDRLLLKFKFSKKVNSGLLVSPKIKIKFI